MDQHDDVYPGGFHRITRQFEKARKPFQAARSYLPKPDFDITALQAQTVKAPDQSPDIYSKSDIRRRHLELLGDFQGQSQLLYVHAMSIATLRRDNPPDAALPIFMRLWSERGTWLAKSLPMRWRIAAATTFGDHGQTPGQRALGMGLSVLFDMIKLHESERRMTGQSSDAPFAQIPHRKRDTIAFDLPPYATKYGDLDRNLLARLWRLGEAEPVAFPLARSMLGELMTDRRTVFARYQAIRAALS